MLNLLLSILANTYQAFDPRSQGLYLSRILAMRDELMYDENYGAYLSDIPIINLIMIPFLPFALLLSPTNPINSMLNKILTKVQYIIFMMLLFLVFLGVNLILLPFAYIVGVLDKMKTLKDQTSFQEMLTNNLLFIPFGVPILLCDLLADLAYFWIYNFNIDLKKIIIIKKKTNLAH